jgi:hypothetical protein
VTAEVLEVLAKDHAEVKQMLAEREAANRVLARDER